MGAEAGNKEELATKKSRIKKCRRKRRPSSHNCPQCGQFPGVVSDLIPEGKTSR